MISHIFYSGLELLYKESQNVSIFLLLLGKLYQSTWATTLPLQLEFSTNFLLEGSVMATVKSMTNSESSTLTEIFKEISIFYKDFSILKSFFKIIFLKSNLGFEEWQLKLNVKLTSILLMVSFHLAFS